MSDLIMQYRTLYPPTENQKKRLADKFYITRQLSQALAPHCDYLAMYTLPGGNPAFLIAQLSTTPVPVMLILNTMAQATDQAIPCDIYMPTIYPSSYAAFRCDHNLLLLRKQDTIPTYPDRGDGAFDIEKVLVTIQSAVERYLQAENYGNWLLQNHDEYIEAMQLWCAQQQANNRISIQENPAIVRKPGAYPKVPQKGPTVEAWGWYVAAKHLKPYIDELKTNPYQDPDSQRIAKFDIAHFEMCCAKWTELTGSPIIFN